MIVHSGCRHFRGDRPCVPHKREGVHCEGCRFHDPVRGSVLVIKLDAVGDVLRTTCILPPLREAHPGARIDWLTRDASVPLFDGNPDVDGVVPFGPDALAALATTEYGLVVNLDAAPLSARLATAARAKRRLGYGYDPKGFVFPWNPEARDWFEMGLFDDVKKANRKTYQRIAAEICGFPGREAPIRLYLSDREKAFARDLAAAWGLEPGRPVVGLNTGAGGRWEHKKWTEEGYARLIGLLAESGRGGIPDPAVLLLGGPEEGGRNRRIAEASGGGAVLTGTGFSLREFMAVVHLCDVVVTGDTMALHVAAALDRKVVAIFGPTSADEIELYGKGIKVVSDAPCVGCYLPSCGVEPTCMERIAPERVLEAVRSLL